MNTELEAETTLHKIMFVQEIQEDTDTDCAILLENVYLIYLCLLRDLHNMSKSIHIKRKELQFIQKAVNNLQLFPHTSIQIHKIDRMTKYRQ